MPNEQVAMEREYPYRIKIAKTAHGGYTWECVVRADEENKLRDRLQRAIDIAVKEVKSCQEG